MAPSNLGPLNPFDTLGRLDRLSRMVSNSARLGVDEAWAALKDVSQGALTIQSMVFEPRRRVVHVALGAGPATSLPPTELRLADWF